MALTKRFTGAAAAMAAATVLAGGAATAQQSAPAQSQPAPQAQMQVEPVTDTEVSQFVAANEEVGAIAAEVTPKLKAAEDKATAQELQKSAQQRMIAAIQDEGLTAQRFTQIAQLAQMDQELAAKLRAEMNG